MSCRLVIMTYLVFLKHCLPPGPAGTGKTESVKALGNQLGRFVLVFNCDETFDFQVTSLVHCSVVRSKFYRISRSLIIEVRQSCELSLITFSELSC